jgi:hypothetical protein
MNGKFAFALALAALTTAAQAEIHTSTSFTITIGNRPAPEPRVVVVERAAPSPVVHVEKPAPRCHASRVVYVEPRRQCGPGRITVLRGRGPERREASIRRDREDRFDHGEARLEGRGPDHEDRLAMDEGSRSINR